MKAYYLKRALPFRNNIEVSFRQVVVVRALNAAAFCF